VRLRLGGIGTLIAILLVLSSIALGLTTPPSPFLRGEGERPEGGFLPTQGEEEGNDEEGELRARDDWFYGQRAYPRARIPQGAYRAAQAKAERIQRQGEAARLAPLPPLNWTEEGPHPVSSLAYASVPPNSGYEWDNSYPYYGNAPLSGRVTAIANDPTDPSIAYLGAATGGVWKTMDGGTTWAPLLDDEPSVVSIAIGSLAIDPNAHTTVYAGTGESSLGYNSYFGSGLYVSHDAGDNWSKVQANDQGTGTPLFDDCYFDDVVVKPGDSNTILAAVHGQGGIYTTTCSQGVYRTTDGGVHWNKVTGGAGRPSDLAVDPNDGTIWYLGYSNGYGVYKSTDSGATWSPKSTGLPTTDIGRTAIAVAPSNSQRLYAAIQRVSTDQLYGIWTSTNGGTSWSVLDFAPDFCGYLDDHGVLSGDGQCGYDLTLAVSPSSATTFYAGGINLYRYSGTPPTPTKVGSGPVSDPASIHVDFHALSFDTSGRLWIGNDGGVYRTSNGTSFTNLNGTLGNIQFYPGVSGSLGGTLAGGSQDNGVSTTTGGVGWTGMVGADGGFSAVAPNPQVIWGTTQQLTIYRSTDGGSHTSYRGPLCGTAWYKPANDPNDP
jgi:hypothetical protein